MHLLLMHVSHLAAILFDLVLGLDELRLLTGEHGLGLDQLGIEGGDQVVRIDPLGTLTTLAAQTLLREGFGKDDGTLAADIGALDASDRDGAPPTCQMGGWWGARPRRGCCRWCGRLLCLGSLTIQHLLQPCLAVHLARLHPARLPGSDGYNSWMSRYNPARPV